jgi:hypothetical protein
VVAVYDLVPGEEMFLETLLNLPQIVLTLDERFAAEEDVGTVFVLDDLALLQGLVEALTGRT